MVSESVVMSDRKLQFYFKPFSPLDILFLLWARTVDSINCTLHTNDWRSPIITTNW